ncbi:MAG: prepilin peptidase CpaA [Thermosediminibacterales bacterium]|nr:prepilin peptidase CpaA [Thermosediminibacterales bacterium]
MIDIFINVLLLVLLSISFYTDVKYNIIPNKITLPVIITALLINGYRTGFSGFLFGLKGLVTGIFLLFIPYCLGGIGAGDVKLLGAVGALKGPLFAVKTILLGGLIGGVIAAYLIYRRGMIKSSAKNLMLIGYTIASGGKPGFLFEQYRHAQTFPYGTAIALGGILSLLLNMY